MLAAEVVKHFLPHLVDLHNYSAAHSVSQKRYNWLTLNSTLGRAQGLDKVLKKIGMQMSKTDTEQVISCAPDAIERVLRSIQLKARGMR